MPDSRLRPLNDVGEMVAYADEDVRGRKVVDDAGHTVGTIDGLMVDDARHTVRFLRVECGGFLGIGATHVMIPVDAISDISEDTVTIDRAGEHLRGAPRYDPKLIDEHDESYWGDIYGYYGYEPFWGLGYKHPQYPHYTR